MNSTLLTPPFESAALAAADTETLKASLLRVVAGRDSERLSKKVKFVSELMPLFEELKRRNPTPKLEAQVPLLEGTWFPLWSTNPFQDIIPGRVHSESYQIFSDRGYYANLARYRPGRKTPLLSWLAQRFLSYDFAVIQRYQIADRGEEEAEEGERSLAAQAGEEYWDIQNICIRQALRLGSPSLKAENAMAWFERLLDDYLKTAEGQSGGRSRGSDKDKMRIKAGQYQQIAKARPLLDNFYIDSDFRLVKTQREKSQRPSYTVATRLD